MSDECEVKRVKVKSSAAIKLVLAKRPKWTARLNVPIQKTNRYQLRICFHIIWFPIVFGTETSDLASAPPSLLIQPQGEINDSYPAGDRTRNRYVRDNDSISTPQEGALNYKFNYQNIIWNKLRKQLKWFGHLVQINGGGKKRNNHFRT